MILGIGGLWSSKEMHEFHLSKSTVNYDTQSQSLQITMHIFIDDLEDALAAKAVPKLYIGTEKEDSTANSYIAQYIANQFTISMGSDTLEQYFLGKELSEDLAAIWCYMEVPQVKLDDNIDFENGLLMEIFDDQKNVMEFRKDKKRYKDFLLQKSDHKATVDLR